MTVDVMKVDKITRQYDSRWNACRQNDMVPFSLLDINGNSTTAPNHRRANCTILSCLG